MSFTEQSARRSVGLSRPRGAAISGRAGTALLVLGLVMVPWIVYLHTDLPAAVHAEHWDWAWTGLDAIEALGLITSGLLLRRGDTRVSLTAMVVATLLSVDAWFDTMTAAPGADLAMALVMAVCVEIPLAVTCAVLAWRRFPARTAG